MHPSKADSSAAEVDAFAAVDEECSPHRDSGMTSLETPLGAIARANAAHAESVSSWSQGQARHNEAGGGASSHTSPHLSCCSRPPSAWVQVAIMPSLPASAPDRVSCQLPSDSRAKRVAGRT
eukprot:scaffold307583_cov32-Tisochrysis_lutea.AAC.5